MTTAVEYSLTASLEGSISLSKLKQVFMQTGWQMMTQNAPLVVSRPAFQLTLIESGKNLFLMDGQFSSISDFNVALQPLIVTMNKLALTYVMDIFEEDGRIVKRLHA